MELKKGHVLYNKPYNMGAYLIKIGFFYHLYLLEKKRNNEFYIINNINDIKNNKIHNKKALEITLILVQLLVAVLELIKIFY